MPLPTRRHHDTPTGTAPMDPAPVRDPEPGPPGAPDPVPWHDPGPPVRTVDLPPDRPGPGIPVDNPER
jgi:hypothetical protein